MKAKLMTKLALAAAVACAAIGGAKAEALYWTVDGVVSTDDKPMSESTPYTTYFFLYKNYIPSEDNWVSKKNTIESLILNRGNVAAWANGSSQYLKTGTSTTGSFSNKGDTFNTTYNTTAFAVVINADTLANATKYMFATTSDGLYYTTASGLTKDNWTTLKETSFGNQTDNKAVWLAIPEPTSGVLLLVGVAALALRRKRVA